MNFWVLSCGDYKIVNSETIYYSWPFTQEFVQKQEMSQIDNVDCIEGYVYNPNGSVVECRTGNWIIVEGVIAPSCDKGIVFEFLNSIF